jgi:hypothetical protein
VTGYHGNGDIWVVKYGGGPADVDAEGKVLEQISIYPNPSRDKIAISVPDLSDTYQFTIVNTAGEEVRKFILTDTSEQYNIQDLPSGMYVLTLYQNNQVAARTKFVKE